MLAPYYVQGSVMMILPASSSYRFLPSAVARKLLTGVVALSSMFAGALSAQELLGTWRGTYECPGPTDLTLIIKRATSRDMQADFVFQPMGGAKRVTPGQFPMKGRRTVGTGFWLTPAAAGTMPPGFKTVELSSALINDGANKKVLSVHIKTCGRGTLSRVPDVTAAEAYSQYASGSFTPIQVPARAQLLDAGICGRIVAWSNQLEDEHPFPGPAYRGSGQPSAELVRPLFTDERFKPVVGKVFTDMQRGELSTMGSKVRQCLLAAKLDPSTRANKTNRLMYPFTSGEGKAVSEFVVSARDNQAWRDATWKEIQAKSPGPQTYDGIVEFSRTLATRDSDMWPREKEAFHKLIDKKRQESAEPALVEQVEKLLIASTTSALLRDLDAQLKSSQLWKDNAPDAVQRETWRLKQKRDHVFAQLIKHEQEQLNSRGKGMEALAWGREWAPRFQTTFASFRDHPSVIAVQTQFQQLRTIDLSDARSDLLALIQAATQAVALDTEVAKYIDKSYDAAAEDGRLILAALDERKKEIRIEAQQRERERRYALEAMNYSSRENQLMASPGHLPLTVPASYTEPDDEEISLAIMREMTAGGGRTLSRSAVEIGVPPFDQIMPIRLDSTKVEKEECKRMDSSHAYTCSFRHFLRVSFPENTRQFFSLGGGNAMFDGMLQKYLASINNARPGVVAHVFVLTYQGWRSPTMRQQSIEAVLNTYAETFSGWPKCNLVQIGNQFRCD